MPTKRKVVKKSTATVDTIGIPLILGGPNADAGPAAEPAKKEPWEVKLEEINKSFEAREKQYGAQLDRLYGLLTNVVSQPVAPQPDAAPAAVKGPILDLAGLPDMSVDPTGYNRGLQDRIQKFQADTLAYTQASATAATAITNDAANHQRRLDALWDKFSTTYEDLADMDDMVQISAKAVLQEVADRGGDVQRFVFADQDRFLAQVAERTRGRLAELGWKPDADAGGDSDPVGGAGEEPASGRTAMVSGQPAATRQSVTGGVREGNPRLEGITAEIADWQNKFRKAI